MAYENAAGRIYVDDAIAISAGSSGNRALRADGTVVTLGLDGANPVLPVSNVVVIPAHNTRDIAVRSDRTVFEWPVPGVSNAVGLSAGTLLLTSGGQVHYWDAGLVPVLDSVVMVRDNGALLADGTLREVDGPYYSNVRNGPGEATNIVSFAIGGSHWVALRKDGTVFCWGSNASGQSDPPANLSNVVAVAAGLYHSVALRADGTVVAWGDGTRGQLDIPNGLSNVVAIAAGTWHTLALVGVELTTPAPVLVHPRFALGQLDQSFQLRPLAKNAPSGFAAAGLPSGTVMDSNTGLISGVPASIGEYDVTLFATNASGVSTSLLTIIVLNGPVPWLISTNFVRAIPFQPFEFQLQLTNRGAVFTAAGLPPGLSVDPQTGRISGTPSQPGLYSASLTASNKYGFVTNTLTVSVDTILGWLNTFQSPAKLPTGRYDAIMLDAAPTHSIALNSDGSVFVFGSSIFDDFVYGVTNVPVSATNIVSVSAGVSFNLALKADGTVLAWGRNSEGQRNVPAGLRAVSISAGYHHSLAVATNGRVFAWGWNPIWPGHGSFRPEQRRRGCGWIPYGKNSEFAFMSLIWVDTISTPAIP